MKLQLQKKGDCMSGAILEFAKNEELFSLRDKFRLTVPKDSIRMPAALSDIDPTIKTGATLVPGQKYEASIYDVNDPWIQSDTCREFCSRKGSDFLGLHGLTLACHCGINFPASRAIYSFGEPGILDARGRLCNPYALKAKGIYFGLSLDHLGLSVGDSLLCFRKV